MAPDPHRVVAFMEEAAREDVLPRYRHLADQDVVEKAPGDLVTVADLDAEKRLTRLLSDHVPGSIVVGEEAVYRNPDLMGELQTADQLWIIDPVDGTANFAAGTPNFAIVVAYLEAGQALGAWIHEPVAGNTATAIRGEGAWIGDERLSVTDGGAIGTLSGLINSNAYGRSFRDEVRPKKEAFGEITRYGCAAHAYRMLASGRQDFSLYNRLWPWDHAAGILLHAEAGGYSARVDHARYRPIDRVQGLLSAPNEQTWREIDAFLRPA